MRPRPEIFSLAHLWDLHRGSSARLQLMGRIRAHRRSNDTNKYKIRLLMIRLQWIFMLTTYSMTSEALVIPSTTNQNTTYDPEKLLQNIFEPLTQRAAGYGLIRFEDQLPYGDNPSDQNDSPDDTSGHSYGLVTFERDTVPHNLRRPENAPVKFEDTQHDGQITDDGAGAGNFHAIFNSNNNEDDGQVQRLLHFENSSNLEGQQPGQEKKRRRRRRRKPRLQQLPFMPGAGVPGQYAPEYQSLTPDPLTSGYHKPLRVVPPAGAVATLTQALSSIARHDDLQCVPRLLCEAAGSATSGSTPSKLLQSISGLKPLLTLLSVGVLGGSPLLMFGRAVLIGTGEAGAAACFPAYPTCPADPERLIHYLNNHNGGFFRFFSASQPLHDLHNQQQPQPYAPNHYGAQGDFQNQHVVAGQHSYDLLQQPSGLWPEQLPGQENYGLLQRPGNYLKQVTDPGNGLALDDQEFSGLQTGYGYQGFGNGNDKDNKYDLNYLNSIANKNKRPEKLRIEKRIQNIRPGKLEFNQVTDTFISQEKYDNYYNKLIFPEESNTVQYLNVNQSNGPEKGFRFPGLQSNRLNLDEKIKYTHKHNIKHYSRYYDYSQQREEIVYVVRGNGDPNHPEIVKLKPGQKL